MHLWDVYIDYQVKMTVSLQIPRVGVGEIQVNSFYFVRHYWLHIRICLYSTSWCDSPILFAPESISRQQHGHKIDIYCKIYNSYNCRSAMVVGLKYVGWVKSICSKHNEKMFIVINWLLPISSEVFCFKLLPFTIAYSKGLIKQRRVIYSPRVPTEPDFYAC